MQNAISVLRSNRALLRSVTSKYFVGEKLKGLGAAGKLELECESLKKAERRHDAVIRVIYGMTIAIAVILVIAALIWMNISD